MHSKTNSILPFAKAIEEALSGGVNHADISRALEAVGIIGTTRHSLYYYRMTYFTNEKLISKYEQHPLPSLYTLPHQSSSDMDVAAAPTQQTPIPDRPAATTPTPTPVIAPEAPASVPNRPRIQSINQFLVPPENIEILTGDPTVISEGVTAQWGRWKKRDMPGPQFICQIVGPDLKVRLGTRLEQSTWAWVYEYCDVPYQVPLIMQEAEGLKMQNKPPDTPVDDQFTMPYGKAPILKQYVEWYESHENEGDG